MKKKTIVGAILTIIMCLCMITGATLALFTSESTVNIAATAGKVKVQASLGNLKTYSATTEMPAETDDYAGHIMDGGSSLGSFSATYYYEKQPDGTFKEGGTAAIVGNTLQLDKIIPGDMALTTVSFTNNSNVDVKYRLSIKCTSGLKLFSGMIFKVEGIGDSNAATNVMSYTSAWEGWEIPASDVAKKKTLSVSVELPLDAGNEYQDLSTNILFAIEAVQGNAATSGEEEIVYVPVTPNAVVAKTATKTVNSSEDTVIETPNTPKGSEEKTTRVTFPAETSTLPDGQTTELTVETYAVEVSSVKFEVESDSQDAYAGLELILKVNDEPVTSFGGKYVKIVTYIEPGLTGVSVKYNGVGEPPIFNSYNSTDGRLEFETNHFSEYYVIADTVAKIGGMPYISLQSAITAAKTGDTIDLVRNVSTAVNVNKYLTINLGTCAITGEITIPTDCRLFEDDDALEIYPVTYESNEDGTHKVYKNYNGKTLKIENEECDTLGEGGACSKCGFDFVVLVANKEELQSAMANTIDGKEMTIKLTANIDIIYETTEIFEFVTIFAVPENKKLVLDLNGYYIKAEKSENSKDYPRVVIFSIPENTTMSFVSSSSLNNKGLLQTDFSWGIIANNGTIPMINNVEMKSTETTVAASGSQYGSLLKNYNTGRIAEINNSKIGLNGEGSHEVDVIYNVGSIGTINNSYIYCHQNGKLDYKYAIVNKKSIEKITNSILSLESEQNAENIQQNFTLYNTGTIGELDATTINGIKTAISNSGTINKFESPDNVVNGEVAGGGTFNIKAGTFSARLLQSYMAPEYVCKENVEGKFIVEYDKEAYEALKAAAIGDDIYFSFASAYEAANNGDTIKLLANLDEQIVVKKSLTIDLNGYNIVPVNATNDFAIKFGTANLDVVITDSSDGEHGSIGTATQHDWWYTIGFYNGTLTLEGITMYSGVFCGIYSGLYTPHFIIKNSILYNTCANTSAIFIFNCTGVIDIIEGSSIIVSDDGENVFSTVNYGSSYPPCGVTINIDDSSILVSNDSFIFENLTSEFTINVKNGSELIGKISFGTSSGWTLSFEDGIYTNLGIDNDKFITYVDTSAFEVSYDPTAKSYTVTKK